MNTKDLKKNTVADLIKEMKEKQEAVREFRFGFSGSKTRDTKSGKNLKKDIARIKTELNSRKEK